MASLIAELKRRNVLKVALGYMAFGWLLVSVADILFPLMDAPEWALGLLLLVTVIGLPIAVILSWIFEITPMGVKRESDIDPAESITRETGKKLNYITIAVLAAALSVSVFLHLDNTDTAEIAALASSGKPSIAVLPFSNRSTNPENALFVDGIHDDVLTNLAHIGALRVISRTSVMEYRNTTKNIRQIAAELGVATVLEGAVQRSGDNVHINVQLIDADTDTHLWARSYDRELTTRNIFEIQSEIAKHISGALKATLSPIEEHRLAVIPTESMEAYNLYRSARHNLEERQLETAILARSQFEQAVKLDPDYSEAYSGLADSVLLLHINHSAVSADEAYALAQENLNTALALDAENADAYASLGLLKQNIWHKTRNKSLMKEAATAFQTALQLNPNHARATMWYAGLKASEHKLKEAIALYQRALEIDPLARIPYANLPGLYAAMGRNQEALDKWLDAARLHPNWPTPYQNLAHHLRGLGRYDESLAWTLKAMGLDTDPLAGSQAIDIYMIFGAHEKALQVVEAFPAEHPYAPLLSLLKHSIAQNYQGMVTEIERLIIEKVELPKFAFSMAADAAIMIDDWDAARKYILKKHPVLADNVLENMDPYLVDYVIKLAYIAKQKGDAAYANQLLEASLIELEKRPRLGASGHGIRDVQILALMNKPDQALARLREAVDAGFRSNLTYDHWTLLEDPLLENIHSDPQFIVMHEQTQEMIKEMRQRTIEAEATGDWGVLRTLATTQPVIAAGNFARSLLNQGSFQSEFSLAKFVSP